MSFGSAIFNKILVTYSADAVSAYQISSRIDHLFFMPVISIVSSMVTLVGMFYGAKKLNLLNKVVYYGLQQAILIASIVGLFFYFFAENIFPIFTDSENIINYGVEYLRIIVFSYPFVAIGMTSSRIMQGLGYGLPMLLLTSMRVILINVPLSLFFTFVLNKPISYVWYSMLISSFITASVAYPWLRINIRKRKQEIERDTILSEN